MGSKQYPTAVERQEESLPTAETTSLGMCFLGLILSWVIPGAGFILVGRVKRGLCYLIAILTTFFLGMSMHSSIIMPVWSYKQETFNLIANITFIIQMFAGLPALIVFWATNSVPNFAEPSGIAGLLAGDEKHPLFELGSYFIVVAGAMNYFAVGNFYDRVCKLHPRFENQELGIAETQKEPEVSE